MSDATTQYGAIFALGTDGGAHRVLDIKIVEEEAADPMDLTHHQTNGQRPKLPGPPITEISQLEVEVLFDPAAPLPTINLIQEVVVTGPIPLGMASGQILAGSMFCTKRPLSPGMQAASSDPQKGTFVFQAVGSAAGHNPVTRTPAA